jgi:hypothetical protein
MLIEAHEKLIAPTNIYFTLVLLFTILIHFPPKHLNEDVLSSEMTTIVSMI